jgi:hypothetical protein
MKDYIALVTVGLHKFARQIAGSRPGGGSGRCVGWANECNRLFTSTIITG